MPHLLGQKHVHFFGVCDGHGVFGKEVSSMLKSRAHEVFSERLRPLLQDLPHSSTPDHELVRTALRTSCLQLNQELALSQIDVRFR